MLHLFARARERELRQLGELIVLWLECLHPEGWIGSATQLHDELADEAAPRQHVPFGQGLSAKVSIIRDSLAAAGWHVRIGRTSAGRYIAFQRAHDDDGAEINTR